jgi:DNA-binding protein H-NS
MPRRSGPDFDGMSVSQLLKLRDQIHAALAGKRKELQRQIDDLAAFETSGPTMGSRGRPGRRARATARFRGNGTAHPLKGRTVAAKYRDPSNLSQTWAGRGQAPRWLTAYEAQGRKRDEFLIGASQSAPAKRRGGKRS